MLTQSRLMSLSAALLAVAACSLFRDASRAEDPPPAHDVSISSLIDLTAGAQIQRQSDSVMRKKLGKRIKVEFDATPLHEALTFLEELSGISRIRIDEKTFNEEGVPVDMPVSFAAQDLPVGSVLHHVLKGRHELAWVIENETLVVTTKVNADEKLTTRAFPVGSILTKQIAEIEAHPPESLPADGISAPDQRKPQEVARRNLIHAVMTCTPGPWKEVDGSGGTINSHGSVLVIRQTQQTLDEIGSLLRGLEAHSAGKLQQGVALVRPAWEPSAQHTALNEALSKKLPAPVDFQATPLKEAMNFLSDLGKAPIRFDEAKLADNEIPLDKPVTFSASDITLHSVLAQIADSLDLAVEMEHGFLVLTTREAADEHFDTRIYDVRDLLAADRNVLPLIDLVMQETKGPWQGTDGTGGVLDAPLDGALVIRQSQAQHAEIALLLADLREAIGPDGLPAEVAAAEKKPDEKPDAVEIRFYPLDRRGAAAEARQSLLSFVAPESWKEAGGAGIIRSIGETLTIQQTRRVHGEIQKFLDDLKASEK